MSEPFLILHKVRGAPAFDIAILAEDMGTETDPGPWWIISTSGHRAHPIMFWKFDNLHMNEVKKDMGPIEWHPGWDSLPDHCQYDLDRTPTSPIVSTDVASALAKLIKPAAPLVRRKL